MATVPRSSSRRPRHRPALEPCRLTAFTARWAETVAGWVRNEADAFWLAPRTAPPITADHVRSWDRAGRHPFLLWAGERSAPAGYGEINELSRRGAYWLGHLIVDGDLRGNGLGRELARLLAEHAVVHFDARSVSLVVFRDNLAGMRAYEAAGFRRRGYEYHSFPVYNLRTRLVRMEYAHV